MKAKITDVAVQTGNQLNVTVNYNDPNTGFDRDFIFTIPASDVKRLSDPVELEKAILAQGKEFKEIDSNKSSIVDLVGTEFDIK